MARVSSKSTAAKNRPALKSKIVASEELAVAPEKTVQFTPAANATVGRIETGSDIEIQGDVHGLNDKAAKLAFMEEFVVVELSEGTERDAEKAVFLSVNGVGAGPNGFPWVPRGIPVKIKRKYLNVLAGARQVRYQNYEKVAPDGERQSLQRATSADRYPFQVMEDNNPRGAVWLRELRATRRAG
jgi:hypothetical protein